MRLPEGDQLPPQLHCGSSDLLSPQTDLRTHRQVVILTCQVEEPAALRLPPATLNTTPATLQTNVRNRTIPGILTPLR